MIPWSVTYAPITTLQADEVRAAHVRDRERLLCTRCAGCSRRPSSRSRCCTSRHQHRHRRRRHRRDRARGRAARRPRSRRCTRRARRARAFPASGERPLDERVHRQSSLPRRAGQRRHVDHPEDRLPPEQVAHGAILRPVTRFCIRSPTWRRWKQAVSSCSRGARASRHRHRGKRTSMRPPRSGTARRLRPEEIADAAAAQMGRSRLPDFGGIHLRRDARARGADARCAAPTTRCSSSQAAVPTRSTPPRRSPGATGAPQASRSHDDRLAGRATTA